MPRDSSSVRLSWYVNTNEDVADFRVEVSSLADQKPRTLLVKDIAYNARYDVIKNVPGARGQELRMCLLVKNSLGRLSLDMEIFPVFQLPKIITNISRKHPAMETRPMSGHRTTLQLQSNCHPS